METLKRHAGRPTLYNPKYIDEVEKYLETTGLEQCSLPTLQGFSLYIHISLDAIEEWRKRYPAFNGALRELMNRQAQQLIDNGIYGGKEVNATIVKLLLQNNHGMREKQDVTTNDKDITPAITISVKHKE